MPLLRRTISLDLSSLHEHIEKLSSALSERDIVNSCSNIAEDLDASYFSYSMKWSDNFNSINYKKITNYNAGCTGEYNSESCQLIEPDSRESIQSICPIIWSSENLDLQKHLTQQETLMMENSYAYEQEISAGIIAPILGFHDINGAFELDITSESHLHNKQEHLEEIAPYITYLGGFVQQAMIRLLKLNEDDGKKAFLTKREYECLCWAADGKTASEIASNLFISESTVKFHFRNLMKKLNTRNTAQAIAVAIRKGYI